MPQANMEGVSTQIRLFRASWGIDRSISVYHLPSSTRLVEEPRLVQHRLMYVIIDMERHVSSLSSMFGAFLRRFRFQHGLNLFQFRLSLPLHLLADRKSTRLN